jgi:hypothetical protein
MHVCCHILAELAAFAAEATRWVDVARDAAQKVAADTKVGRTGQLQAGWCECM